MMLRHPLRMSCELDGAVRAHQVALLGTRNRTWTCTIADPVFSFIRRWNYL